MVSESLPRQSGRKRSLGGASLSEISFDHVVHDPRTMPFFLDYLAQNNKAELFLFWMEAEQYKQLPGRTADMLAQASKIYQVSSERALIYA